MSVGSGPTVVTESSAAASAAATGEPASGGYTWPGFGSLGKFEPGVTFSAEAGSGSGSSSGQLTVFRGTNNANELQIASESGYLFSDAGREGYMSARAAGLTVQDATQTALATSSAAEARQVGIWGGFANYVEAHGAFGTELNAVGPRSLVSVTTNPAIAGRFADLNGAIFSLSVPSSAVTAQTLFGAGESELLIRNGIRVVFPK